MADLLWNLAAYTLQIAALVAIAVIATSLLRLRLPRHSLRFWQTVMAIALILPLAQPRGATPTGLQLITRTISAPALDGSTTASSIDVITIVLLLIAGGVAARLLWLGLGLIRLRSIVARATPHESLSEGARELMQSLGISASILVSDDLEGPATVGWRRPVVLVPRSVLVMPAAVQQAILCHELLHVKRRDWLCTIGEEIWRSLFWFHPLARLIASKLWLAREMVVDEMTIFITRDRRAYAEALLAFSNPQPHMIGVTPFIGRRTLSQRISLIAEESSMSRNRLALSKAALALAACIGVTASAIDRFPMFATLHAQSTVYRPGDGVSLPVVVTEVKPSYTAAAMQAQVQGSVWLECVVNDTGDIPGCVVTKSLDTEHGLDQAALDAATQWKFKPGQKDGKPVAVAIVLELTFTLKK
jgi:TonB family protein